MKKLLTPLIALIASIPFAFAVDLTILEQLFGAVFRIGSFVWVTDVISATKFAIFVILFAIIFGVLHAGFVSDTGLLKNRKVSVVIAFSLAAIATIFMPNEVVRSFGELYSAIAAIIFIGLPVGLLVWFCFSKSWGLPKMLDDGSGSVPDNKKWILHGVRLLVALACLSIVTGIAQEYGYVSSFIFPLFILKRGEN